MPPFFPSSVVKMLVGVTCLTIAAVYAQIYLLTIPVVERNAANDARKELAELSTIFENGGVASLKSEMAKRIERGAEGDALYALANSDAELIAGNLAEWPLRADLSGRWRSRTHLRNSDGVFSAGYRAAVLSGGPMLLVGRNMTERTQLTQLLRRSLAYSIGVVLLSTALAAWFFSSVFNRRMRAISDAAEGITSGDFSRRVPTAGDDEFSSLALSINMMLERIESMMGSTRMVTDSIAHHVRSALVRVTARVEALSDEPEAAAIRKELCEPAERMRELLRILDGLIEIARADADLSRDQMRSVDVERLLRDLVEIYGPLAEERGVALRVDIRESWPLVAHEVLLAQALSNLIENALKYAGAGREIALTAEETPEGPRISVADNGPGIPAQQRAQALARFARLGNAQGKDGVGLGLSIVAAIARLHRAEFLLEDNAPGLRASLRFSAKPIRPAFWRRLGARRSA